MSKLGAISWPHACSWLTASYGKSRIRLVQRHAAAAIVMICATSRSRSASKATTTQSYTDGDNTDVLPTDTMKNTVYALAARDGVAEPEPFGLTLGRALPRAQSQTRRVRVDSLDHPWERISVRRPRDTANRSCDAGPTRARRSVRASGCAGLDRRRHHAICHHEDRRARRLRDSPATSSRRCRKRAIGFCATSLTATWHYGIAEVDFDATLARGAPDAARILRRT